jgi:hypothetical protein
MHYREAGEAGRSAKITYLRRSFMSAGMLTGRKLAVSLGFTVLVALAFGVSCRGFFTSPTIASFVISPTNPTVAYPNGTQQMAAYGTDTNGNPTGNITNQVSWSSSDDGVISVGTASLSGTTPGLLTALVQSTSPVTITANYQALAAQTATATVCVLGASDPTIAPENYVDNTGATSQSYTLSVTVNGQSVDVTASAQWTTTNTAVTIADGTTPAIATITPPAAGSPAATGTITATYTCGGNTLTATTNVTVNPTS